MRSNTLPSESVVADPPECGVNGVGVGAFPKAPGGGSGGFTDGEMQRLIYRGLSACNRCWTPITVAPELNGPIRTKRKRTSSDDGMQD